MLLDSNPRQRCIAMEDPFYPDLLGSAIELLFFSVPPQKPLIMDERGRQVEGEMGIGPFREGDSLTLECHVSGGKSGYNTFEFTIYIWS